MIEKVYMYMYTYMYMYIRHNSKLDRLLYHTEITNSCWNWLGIINTTGYGKLKVNKKWYKAHRYSYELFVDDIPKDMTIDHKCFNKLCVNPEHLEVVSRRVNTLRYLEKRWGKQYA